MLLQLLLISIVLISFALAGLAIKMFFIKGAEFKKTCGSVDPKTGQKIGCTCGNEDGGGSCENKERYNFETVKID